jgi:hypothetical protein
MKFAMADVLWPGGIAHSVAADALAVPDGRNCEVARDCVISFH